MKDKLLNIVQNLKQGKITEHEAQIVLLELLDADLYDMLAAKNNLIETDIPNVWVRNELGRNDLFNTTYVLNKLGFVVKHDLRGGNKY